MSLENGAGMTESAFAYASLDTVVRPMRPVALGDSGTGTSMEIDVAGTPDDDTADREEQP